MATVLPRLTYGWRVTTSNNKLDFKANNVTYAATLRLGDYGAGLFAAEVQRAMRAVSAVGNETCAYSFTTRKFTLTGTAVFQLLFATGANAASDCNGLLGFTAADETGAATYSSDDTAGTASGTFEATGVYSWAPTDPAVSSSPVTAAADGTTATRLGRRIKAAQAATDGGLLETVYFSEDKLFRIRFAMLGATGSPTEQTHMERLLDWIRTGAPIDLQPDATSTNNLRLVLSEPGQMMNSFSWTTREEVDYVDLDFVQQLART